MTPIKMTLREIDAAVAERVMGWKPTCRHEVVTVLRGSLVQCDRCGAKFGTKFGTTTLAMARAAADPLHYSTDIVAAWEVLTAIAGRGQLGFSLRLDAGKPAQLTVGINDPVPLDAAPLAICLAALRAHDLKVEVIT